MGLEGIGGGRTFLMMCTCIVRIFTASFPMTRLSLREAEERNGSSCCALQPCYISVYLPSLDTYVRNGALLLSSLINLMPIQDGPPPRPRAVHQRRMDNDDRCDLPAAPTAKEYRVRGKKPSQTIPS